MGKIPKISNEEYLENRKLVNNYVSPSVDFESVLNDDSEIEVEDFLKFFNDEYQKVKEKYFNAVSITVIFSQNHDHDFDDYDREFEFNVKYWETKEQTEKRLHREEERRILKEKKAMLKQKIEERESKRIEKDEIAKYHELKAKYHELKAKYNL